MRGIGEVEVRETGKVEEQVRGTSEVEEQVGWVEVVGSMCSINVTKIFIYEYLTFL